MGQMRVLHEAPTSWFLVQDGRDLWLDVNCEPAACTVRLTAEEAALYRRGGGRPYIASLAESLGWFELSRRHDSAVRPRVSEAVRAWRRGS